MNDQAQPAPAAATAEGSAAPPKPVRVGWVAGEDTFLRFARALQPVAIGMMEYAVQITLFGPGGAEEGELSGPFRDTVRYDRPRWYRPIASRDSLTAAVQARRMQILHALEAGPAALTLRAARDCGIRYLVSCHDLHDGRRLGTVDETALGVLASSAPVQAALLEQHVATADRIHLVRPGAYAVRRPTCFTHDERSVAVVAAGRMDDFDAFHAVLRAFEGLRKRDYDCAFFVIGNGRAERRVRAAAVKMGLGHAVTFVDSQSAAQLTGIFKAADLCISPVSGPMLDLNPLLAMSAGVPVVAVASEVADFLIDERTALLFERGNAEDLTAKLIGLLDDRAGAEALAARAIAHVAEHHSPSAAAKQLASLIRAAVD